MLITVNSNFNPTGAWGWLTVYRDSTDLGPFHIIHHPTEDNRVFNTVVLDVPGAIGSYTYKAMFKICSGCTGSFTVNQVCSSQIAAVALAC